jgi:betaine-aldehyde dehydrogenase
VDAAIRAAHVGFRVWRQVKPLERGRIVREAAALTRRHGRELALIEAADCGNPARELMKDVEISAVSLEYFVGLAMDVKRETFPMGEGTLNDTVREPLGVIARINTFNHPFMFAATKAGAPLVAGNGLVIKPPEQAPLSGLRLAEILGPLFPAGVLTELPGGRSCGEALVTHPLVVKIGLIGAVSTGRAILPGAAEGMKKVKLELGGKNALIAFPDTDPVKVTAGIVRGMNFAWCGQSCGSTSRAFVHDTIYDEVLAHVVDSLAEIKPGLPTDWNTDMGCLVSQAHYDKLMGYVEVGRAEGARVASGGKRPDDPRLAHGLYLEPTVFANVQPHMRIAREEIFGPVLSIFRWSDGAEMLRNINDVEYGLTAAIWTQDLGTAHRIATEVEAGYVWVSNSSMHFLGAPFGGWKQSGLGREESLDELLDCTELKNINVTSAA